MPAELDIEVPRNGDYFKRWYILDDQAAGIDITGWNLGLWIRTVAGDANPPVAYGHITGRDDANGSFNVKITGSEFVSVPGGQETVTLAYDFAGTDTTGVKVVETRGHIFLKPGVTFL